MEQRNKLYIIITILLVITIILIAYAFNTAEVLIRPCELCKEQNKNISECLKIPRPQTINISLIPYANTSKGLLRMP